MNSLSYESDTLSASAGKFSECVKTTIGDRGQCKTISSIAICYTGQVIGIKVISKEA